MIMSATRIVGVSVAAFPVIRAFLPRLGRLCVIRGRWLQNYGGAIAVNDCGNVRRNLIFAIARSAGDAGNVHAHSGGR